MLARIRSPNMTNNTPQGMQVGLRVSKSYAEDEKKYIKDVNRFIAIISIISFMGLPLFILLILFNLDANQSKLIGVRPNN